ALPGRVQTQGRPLPIHPRIHGSAPAMDPDEVERNPDSWPDVDRGEFLTLLDEFASSAVEQGTLEGALSSVLVYHQLADEQLKLLLRCSQFLLQVAVHPHEIRFAEGRRPM